MISVLGEPEETIGLNPWTDIPLPQYVAAYLASRGGCRRRSSCLLRGSLKFSYTVSPVNLQVNRFRNAYVAISFLGFHTSLLIFGVYLLCINRRTLRWTFIIISLFMFTVATADISLSLVFLFHRLLKGRGLPVLHPHPKLLLFLTNKYVDHVPFLGFIG